MKQNTNLGTQLPLTELVKKQENNLERFNHFRYTRNFCLIEIYLQFFKSSVTNLQNNVKYFGTRMKICVHQDFAHFQIAFKNKRVKALIFHGCFECPKICNTSILSPSEGYMAQELDLSRYLTNDDLQKIGS